MTFKHQWYKRTPLEIILRTTLWQHVLLFYPTDLLNIFYSGHSCKAQTTRRLPCTIHVSNLCSNGNVRWCQTRVRPRTELGWFIHVSQAGVSYSALKQFAEIFKRNTFLRKSRWWIFWIVSLICDKFLLYHYQ